jgi:hypothetical protein
MQLQVDWSFTQYSRIEFYGAFSDVLVYWIVIDNEINK